MKHLLIAVALSLMIFPALRAEGLPKTETKASVAASKNLDLAAAILMPKPNNVKFNRDPFMPLSGSFYKAGSNGASGEMRLVGILYKDQAPLALMETFDGPGVFKKGDKIGEYTVLKIYSKRIILQKGKKHYTFELGDEDEK